jgi:hypothetical protein
VLDFGLIAQEDSVIIIWNSKKRERERVVYANEDTH